MIETLGNCTIQNIHCKYHFTGNKLYLIPVDNNEISTLYHYLLINNINFIEIPSSYSTDKYDYIYFSEVHFNFGGVSLDVDMYFELYSNTEIKSIVITSDAINFYVNPAEYFYDLKQLEESYIEPELLYKSKGIHEFLFNFEGIKINSRLVIGDILQRGIASDLKLNTKLELNFNPTNDREFIIRLQNAVKKCIKFAMYNDEIIFNRIELIGNSEKRTICGSIFLNQHNENVGKRFSSLESNFYWLKDYLGEFFEVVANDSNLFSAHLKNSYNQLNSNEIRFANIFAAFETEYMKLPKQIRFHDTTSIEPFRKRLIDTISEVPVGNEEEKVFIEQLISKTKELGKMYGSRKKILIAIEYIKDCILSSLEARKIDEKQIKYFSKHIPDIRNKIVHNNYEGDIGDQLGISLMEWITYAMLLKRVGIPSKKIEYILGRVFKSNSSEFKK